MRTIENHWDKKNLARATSYYGTNSTLATPSSLSWFSPTAFRPLCVFYIPQVLIECAYRTGCERAKSNSETKPSPGQGCEEQPVAGSSTFLPVKANISGCSWQPSLNFNLISSPASSFLCALVKEMHHLKQTRKEVGHEFNHPLWWYSLAIPSKPQDWPKIYVCKLITLGQGRH